MITQPSQGKFTSLLKPLLVASADQSWPAPLSPDAFYGPAGEVVRTLDPHTESDPAAILLQLLVAFGNVVGRSAYFVAEADRHSCNLFAAIVGDTSKARKGTSWGYVARLFSLIDPFWSERCLQSGLNSGEGLIHAVRDPKDGDGGALDKRLLVHESEFASTLRVMSRDGNTLSPLIRQAWDGKNLQILTKQFPETATGGHISIVSHVTRDELRYELTRIQAGNGFGNRFLWSCARRSKVLPHGGRLSPLELERLAGLLKRPAESCISRGEFELSRDSDADALWVSTYRDLSEGRPGLLGAIISRAEAQVMRLAVVYALLDNSTEVRREHLSAALAVWRYCEGSARYIFGSLFGYELADSLLRLLAGSPQGLTRTQISAALHHNRTRTEIESALQFLGQSGLVMREATQTAGRPVESWRARTNS